MELLLWVDEQSVAWVVREGGLVSHSTSGTERVTLFLQLAPWSYCLIKVKQNWPFADTYRFVFNSENNHIDSYIYFLYNFSYRVKYYTRSFSENN